jgi:hypothetical protein
MKVCLEKGMVDDGAVPELSVGDSWLVDLMFQPDFPMMPVTEEFDAGMWPLIPLDEDPTPRYHITAEVRRCRPEGSGDEVNALVLPEAMLGLRSNPPLPEAHRIHGSGVIRVDPWWNVTRTFPETRRKCVVESLTCLNVPRTQRDDGRFYPDWPRHARHTIDRINVRQDFPDRLTDVGFYSVQVSLL